MLDIVPFSFAISAHLTNLNLRYLISVYTVLNKKSFTVSAWVITLRVS